MRALQPDASYNYLVCLYLDVDNFSLEFITYILHLYLLLAVDRLGGLLPHAVNCGRFCFWRHQSVFFVCV